MTLKDSRIAKRCKTCKGRGKVDELRKLATVGITDWVLVPCPMCGGSGVARPECLQEPQGEGKP